MPAGLVTWQKERMIGSSPPPQLPAAAQRLPAGLGTFFEHLAGRDRLLLSSELPGQRGDRRRAEGIGDGARLLLPAERRGQRGGRRRAEEIEDGDRPAEALAEAVGGADHGQGVAAEVEEVVLATDAVEAEHLAENRRDLALQGGARLDVGGRGL